MALPDPITEPAAYRRARREFLAKVEGEQVARLGAAIDARAIEKIKAREAKAKKD